MSIPTVQRMLVCIACCVVGASASAFAGELAVLDGQHSDPAPRQMMTAYLQGLAHAALDRRAAEIEKLVTVEQLRDRQARLRAFFVEQMGGWPERTPLNARVVGTLARDGYRIEKVIYESQPGFPVTGLLYLPDAAGPYPGVLVPCGHSAHGKGEPAYQQACILLARNGLAALCYDPISQGERHQILDGSGQPRFGSVLEHTLVGVGCILLGTNTARYRIWDGMRGLDYLVSRGDIDAERIGCAGNSGGGTLTSYLMALDPRVKCAAPNCYLCSLGWLIDGIGPQDAEQNIHAQVAFGMEHADYVTMRAPLPTLICAATRDFFDINATWRTFREAKRCYTRMGFAERVDLVETDTEHGFTPQIRVGTVRWMRRWLLGKDDAITESESPILSDEQVRCTPKGQVLLMEGVRSVFDFNAEWESRLAGQRRKFVETASADEFRQRVRQTAGIRPLGELPEPQIEERGILPRDGYRIRKLVLRPEAGILLPALVFEPDAGGKESHLYCHGQGKDVDAAPGQRIEQLARQGHRVLAVDLRGIGETEGQTTYQGFAELFGSDWQDFFRAYLLGESYVGMRAEDVLVCARYLGAQQGATGGAGQPVHVIGIGEAGPPVLHAAALEPGLFASVRIERSIVSWSNVVKTAVTKDQLINTVHAALTSYDLPDLVRLVPPDRVTVADPAP